MQRTIFCFGMLLVWHFPGIPPLHFILPDFLAHEISTGIPPLHFKLPDFPPHEISIDPSPPGPSNVCTGPSLPCHHVPNLVCMEVRHKHDEGTKRLLWRFALLPLRVGTKVTPPPHPHLGGTT